MCGRKQTKSILHTGPNAASHLMGQLNLGAGPSRPSSVADLGRSAKKPASSRTESVYSVPPTPSTVLPSYDMAVGRARSVTGASTVAGSSTPGVFATPTPSRPGSVLGFDNNRSMHAHTRSASHYGVPTPPPSTSDSSYTLIPAGAGANGFENNYAAPTAVFRVLVAGTRTFRIDGVNRHALMRLPISGSFEAFSKQLVAGVQNHLNMLVARGEKVGGGEMFLVKDIRVDWNEKRRLGAWEAGKVDEWNWEEAVGMIAQRGFLDMLEVDIEVR